MNHFTRITRTPHFRRSAEIDLGTRRSDRPLLPVADLFQRYV